jgi:hypothetical protein
LCSTAIALAAAVASVPARAQESTLAGGLTLLPPGAKPGECYTRVYVPPTYESATEQVLKRAASEKVEIIPARFETVEERVLIKEEAEKIEVVPATFKEVEERVLVRPESEELVAVQPEYEDVKEQVMVQPAYVSWKKGRGPIEKIDETTGEIMCLVEVPAEYKTVIKRVVKKPGNVSVVKKPAEYKSVKKLIIDQPATTRVVKIPPEYATVKVQKLVEPAKETRVAVPEEYETVTKTAKKTEGRLEWRQILCETNVTPEVVKKIQDALKVAGVYKGPSDGNLGPGTVTSIVAYQKAKGLPSGQLTMETLRSLEVKL